MGNDTLERERLGNLQLQQMMKIIAALVKHKVPFTIENPIQSLLWETAELKQFWAWMVAILQFSTSVFLGSAHQIQFRVITDV